MSSPWYLDDMTDLYSSWWRYLKTEIADFANNTRPELVLGGEACMWGEWVDATNIIPRYGH